MVVFDDPLVYGTVDFLASSPWQNLLLNNRLHQIIPAFWPCIHPCRFCFVAWRGIWFSCISIHIIYLLHFPGFFPKLSLCTLLDLVTHIAASAQRSFQKTMAALEELSGYDEGDVRSALIVEDDPDQSGGGPWSLSTKTGGCKQKSGSFQSGGFQGTQRCPDDGLLHLRNSTLDPFSPLQASRGSWSSKAKGKRL